MGTQNYIKGRKMKVKKILKGIACGCISAVLLSSTACGYFMYIGTPEVKWVELSDGTKGISYNGAIYRAYESPGMGLGLQPNNSDGEYHLNFAQGYKIPLAYNQILGRFPVYVSAMDEEEMVLYVWGAVAWHQLYVKEGFELPDMETTTIVNMFLLDGWEFISDELKIADRYYIDEYAGGCTLYDMVEEEAAERKGRYVDACYLELEGYEYLQAQLSVYEVEDTLYLCFSEYRYDEMHEIKPEYQEMFRNALETFEAIVEENA